MRYTANHHFSADGLREENNHQVDFKLPSQCIPVLGLAELTFLVFVTYSLVVTNSETVFTNCGNSLWNYMISRLILGYLFLFFYCLVVCGVFTAMSTMDACTIACIFFTVFVYHISLVGVGAKVITDAMHNTGCTSSLSEVSFTHSPLLAQLGYVYLSLDCIWVFLMMLAVCCFGGCSMCND